MLDLLQVGTLGGVRHLTKKMPRAHCAQRGQQREAWPQRLIIYDCTNSLAVEL